jgi:lysophospholipase L1-like esterase
MGPYRESLVSTPYLFWLADHPAGAILLWSSFLFALVGLIVAIWLLVRAARGWLVNLGLVVVAVAFAVLVGEVVARLYYLQRYDIDLLVSMRVHRDEVLGWEGTKEFGDPHSRRFKIFVIGDSFTEGAGVPRGARYYNVLGRTLDAEIFAYGGGGYGTLQEYLVMDRHLPEIEPNAVLLQVHSNDFINNSWELERASYFNNNLAVRPYQVGDNVEYHFPSRLGGLRLFLAAHSRLFYDAILDVERLGADLASRNLLRSVEADIQARGLEFAPFRRAVQTTDALIARMKRRAGNIPLVAFPADRDDHFFEQWRAIFQRNEIPFIESLPGRIRDAETKGAKLRLSDGAHWNAEGHALCGTTLAEWFVKERHDIRQP